MTIVNREITREETETKTVQTCDVCGLSEVEMDDETIDKITSGMNTSMRYVLIYHELDGVDGRSVGQEQKEFDTYNEATTFLDELDMDTHSIERKISYLSMDWDLNIDACTRCQTMMFGALRNDFSMKSV